jgi:type II secretory pathway pseudopilin PulG
MTIGVAIIIAAILFLIDRNHVWPQVWRMTKRVGRTAGKMLLVLIVASLGTYVIFYTWGEVKDAREKRESEAAQKAEEARANRAIANRWAQLGAIQKDVCGDKQIAVFNSSAIGGFPETGEVACTTEKSKSGSYTEALPLSTTGCAVLQSAIPAFTCKLAPAPLPVAPRATASSAGRLRFTASSAIDLTSTQFGSLKTGEVKPNDIVTLLENTGFGSIRVRTASGKVGWISDAFFEVIN